jgi:YD repeat-containing protein
MKHLFIAVLLFCSCKNAEHINFLPNITNDRDEAHLKGKVKKLVETEYENGQPVYIRRREYNEMGFIVNEDYKRLQNDGKWDSATSFYTYDTIDGIKRIESIYNTVKQTPRLWYYDRKGNLLHDTSNMGGHWYRYQFDTLNRMEEKMISRLGVDHNLTTWIYYRDGSIRECVFDVAENQKMSETIHTDSTEIFKAYHKGRCVQKQFKQKDTAGNTIFLTNDVDLGCLTTSGFIKYYYNSHNDMVMEVHKSVDKDHPDTTRYEYTYDKAGNWLRINKTKERTITYW